MHIDSEILLHSVCQFCTSENPGDKKAPEFLKPLHDVDVKVGARVKFRVKLSGYPQPKVNWYKDGKKLRSSEQCKLGKTLIV